MIATVLRACAALLIVSTATSVSAFETQARAAYIFDQTTGTVLFEKDADVPLPPASMSKLMTIYMAFDAVANGQLQIDQRLPVSEHASSFGGSTMFLDTTDRVTVEDLLRGVIVLSGNDASVVLAEGIAGTEPDFARLTNEVGRRIGLTNSTFVNSSGWPAAGHRMSMRDLGTLADRLISDFPTFYPLFAETRFEFDGRAPANSNNRNPLLRLGIGADGLKTGHTQEAGYGLVGSAKRGDRRVIFVITGLETTRARAEEAERIVNWAFNQFTEREVVRSGTRIAEADVWMGSSNTVGLTVAEDVDLLMPVVSGDEFEATINYSGPIAAPIREGQTVGELVISRLDLPEVRVPLVTTAAVQEGGFETRLRVAAQVILQKIGALRSADDPT